MNYRLAHVENCIPELYHELMSKLDDGDYQPRLKNLLIEPDALVRPGPEALVAR